MRKYLIEYGIAGEKACGSFALTGDREEADQIIRDAISPGFWGRIWIWSESLNNWEICVS